MSKWFTIIYLIAEIAAFIALGEWIGYGWTVLLVLGLFIVGLIFAAIEFKRIYQKLLLDTSRTLTEYGQKHPEEAIKRSAKGAGHFVADSAILLVGSWLIALPGVVTTVVGFLMVLPPTRWLIRKSGSVALLNGLRNFSDRSMMVVSQYGMTPGTPGAGAGAGAGGFSGFPGFSDGFPGADGKSFPQDKIVPPAPDNAWDDDQDDSDKR